MPGGFAQVGRRGERDVAVLRRKSMRQSILQCARGAGGGTPDEGDGGEPPPLSYQDLVEHRGRARDEFLASKCQGYVNTPPLMLPGPGGGAGGHVGVAKVAVQVPRRELPAGRRLRPLKGGPLSLSRALPTQASRVDPRFKACAGVKGPEWRRPPAAAADSPQPLRAGPPLGTLSPLNVLPHERTQASMGSTKFVEAFDAAAAPPPAAFSLSRPAADEDPVHGCITSLNPVAAAFGADAIAGRMVAPAPLPPRAAPPPPPAPGVRPVGTPLVAVDGKLPVQHTAPAPAPAPASALPPPPPPAPPAPAPEPAEKAAPPAPREQGPPLVASAAPPTDDSAPAAVAGEKQSKTTSGPLAGTEAVGVMAPMARRSGHPLHTRGSNPVREQATGGYEDAPVLYTGAFEPVQALVREATPEAVEDESKEGAAAEDGKVLHPPAEQKEDEHTRTLSQMAAAGLNRYPFAPPTVPTADVLSGPALKPLTVPKPLRYGSVSRASLVNGLIDELRPTVASCQGVVPPPLSKAVPNWAKKTKRKAQMRAPFTGGASAAPPRDPTAVRAEGVAAVLAPSPSPGKYKALSACVAEFEGAEYGM
eukprot:TRINITY_DN3265_c0_g2_i1.p1 TRINITY_DN3265_c0_g2~~TRINITY_DN3265_c0_g2_i1.p1  ORF type:complete len:590 (+),score=110.79 TRINITY_DN3265_c0_g2_i1:21-1790(+)